MDYLFTSSVAGVGIRLLTISYDVGCQWFTNFWNRMGFLPERLRLSLPQWAVRALVPKFHLQSHEEKCHSKFSFNFFFGGARTEGEGVERNWKELNGQAASTAEMTPGHRWETLDYCCGWLNFRKTMGLGMFVFHEDYNIIDSSVGNLLLKRLLLAISRANQSRKDFTAFNESLQAEVPDEVKEAERAIAAWEKDKTQPDPYRVPKSSEYIYILQLFRITNNL